ncbi:MAG TPA: hypothetical protein VJT73_01930 [Polyangiaceae bacterium]|nr:hypothetical protein [Polyangiaceae bacterium]
MTTGVWLTRTPLFLVVALVVGLVTCSGSETQPSAGSPTIDAGPSDGAQPAVDTGPRVAAPADPTFAQVSGGGQGRSSNFRLWLSFGAPQPQGAGKGARYGLVLGPP